MIGQTISHYRILEKLGEGGMGVVYKAEDTKLKRTVALKFLPPELICDTKAKERFVREAQAASALDHPNICTVYEIDDADDRTFIAMACIDGNALSTKIRSGPVKLDEAIDLAIQAADGLQAAHEKGIVHRDIKPPNLMVTSKGLVKITDFGLALSGGQTRLTKEGSTAGTVAYMSPEQARGSDVDRRTDIWSLGVVLYEMISGRLPFTGSQEAAIVYSIVSEEAEPLTALRTGVPMELERIVARCMEKDPAARYQTAGDLAADLRRLKKTLDATTVVRAKTTTAFAPAARHRWPYTLIPLVVLVAAATVWLIAGNRPPEREQQRAGKMKLVVLPFENLGSPDDEYFADGITEEITSRLAGIHDLGVIARTSAIQYRGTEKSVSEIGEELGADYILEGTIRWQRMPGGGSEVKITPQLIRASDATHLWVDTYQEDVAEVFHLQSEIAERVALALDITLLEPERASLQSHPTENPEAHEFYLRGKDHYNRRPSEQETQSAIAMFEKAVELDPGFAEAWAALARARVWLKWQRGHEAELPAAEMAARKAEALAPDLPETHMAFGDYCYYGSRDYERAIEHYRAVRQMRPSQVEAIASIGYILRRLGDWEGAVRYLEEALELSPRDITLIQPLGRTCVRMRRYPEAEQYLDRALALSPNHPIAYVEKATLYLSWDGDAERARRVMTEAFRSIDPSELLYDTPCFLIRILPDVFGEAWEGFGLGSPGVNAPVDSAMVLLVKAELEALGGEADLAHAHYDSARAILEPLVRAPVSKGYLHGYLAVAYAGLGLGDEAIREAEKAAELLPISKDALSGPLHAERLAEVYIRSGKEEQALEQLYRLLSLPSRLSPSILRLDPIWDPVRQNSRFQRLVAPAA